MKYLEIPALDALNNLLLQLETTDQSKIYGRAEAYSCKFAGNDKKLYKRLSDRYNNQNNHESEMTEDLDLNSIIVVGSGHIPGKISLDATQKVLYYLVSCMNLAFPDFDFSDLTMDNFTSFPSSAIQEISISLNTTLYNVGIAKSPLASFNEFSRNMWTCIDDAILLDDCEIYSYIPDLDANPFSDGLTSCLWSFNYLFWNKKLKRILLFYCRATSLSEEEAISMRSITPFNGSSTSQTAWLDDWKSTSQSPLPDNFL